MPSVDVEFVLSVDGGVLFEIITGDGVDASGSEGGAEVTDAGDVLAAGTEVADVAGAGDGVLSAIPLVPLDEFVE